MVRKKILCTLCHERVRKNNFTYECLKSSAFALQHLHCFSELECVKSFYARVGEECKKLALYEFCRCALHSSINTYKIGNFKFAPK